MDSAVPGVFFFHPLRGLLSREGFTMPRMRTVVTGIVITLLTMWLVNRIPQLKAIVG